MQLWPDVSTSVVVLSGWRASPWKQLFCKWIRAACFCESPSRERTHPSLGGGRVAVLAHVVVTMGSMDLVLLRTQSRPVLHLRGHRRMGSWFPKLVLKITQEPVKGTLRKTRCGVLEQLEGGWPHPGTPSSLPSAPHSPGSSLLLAVAGGEVRLRGHPASCLCTSGDNDTGLGRQGPGPLPTIPMSWESCWA